MTYQGLRNRAKTGDVLAVRGTGFVGTLIRILTGESYSHVALLVWLDAGLYVFEFVEFGGYQSMPASEWIRRRKSQQIYFCRGPQILKGFMHEIRAAAVSYRNASVVSRMYGYFSLVKIWVSQIIGKKIPVRQLVCSTFIQTCWQAGRFMIPGTATPGTIVVNCGEINALYLEDV